MRIGTDYSPLDPVIAGPQRADLDRQCIAIGADLRRAGSFVFAVRTYDLEFGEQFFDGRVVLDRNLHGGGGENRAGRRSLMLRKRMSRDRGSGAYRQAECQTTQ